MGHRQSQERAMQIEAKAQLSFSQGLWYAWGRMDSGEYKGRQLTSPLDAFEFAHIVKQNTIDFESEKIHYNESIQGQWDKYVQNLSPKPSV